MLLVAVLALFAVSAQAASAKTALINASSVSGGLSSQEARIAQNLGYSVTLMTDVQWAVTSQTTFGSYDLLIVGDPACGSTPTGVMTSRNAWGPVVLGTAGGRTAAGNRIVVGTDPVFHDGGDFTSPNARGTVIRTGIAWAGKQPGTTGMYFATSCGGAASVPALQSMSAGTGAWTEQPPPCGGAASLIASNPSFNDLTSASLQGWGCSVHEAYPTFPSDWSALAVATDTATKPTCGVDPATHATACGQAYVLIAGSGIVVTSGSIALSPTDHTSPTGSDHTVTANVTSGSSPLVGQTVSFSVTGQNAGVSGTCAPVTCKSDSTGHVSFTYHDANGAGDDTIKGSFTDAAGSLQAATAQQHWIGVVDPPISATGAPVSATEGTMFTGRVASFTDADAGATAADYTATIDWGDGVTSAGTVASNGAGWDVTGSHVYADEGSKTVHVTVTDTGTPTDTQTTTATATVADAAPTATLNGGNDLSVNEGSTHTYQFTTSDYDDAVSVVTSCGANGTKVPGSDTATSFDCSFADGAASTVVSVTPTNARGTNGAADSQTVSIANVAPTAVLDSGNDVAVKEGSTHHYAFTTSDPGDDSVTVETSCGANGTKVPGSDTATSFDCSFADGPANTDVSVTPTDSDGAVGDAAVQTVAIADVAPSATVSGPDSVNEGSTHTYTFTTSDPGDDSVTVETSCGANGTKVPGSDTATSFDCSFADGPASTDVSVTPTDSDGSAGDAAVQTVSVANVAPTVTLSASNGRSFDESQAGRTFDYTISDPGQDTVQSVATSCGDGGQKTAESNTDTAGSFTCVFAHGPASPTVSVQATDSDGDAGNTDTQSVTVTDPPISASGSPVTAVEAAAFSNQKVASFTDPAGYATADEYSASINWGDGSSSAGTITKTGDGAFDVTGSHTYAEENAAGYAVTVTITDNDNAANSATAHSTAKVADAPIHASGVSLITTPAAYSGPVATFTDEANGPRSDFSATVNWGDGSSSAATISGPSANGTFTVSGSHTYATTGPFTVTVKVTDVGGSTDTATTSVLVYAFATGTGGSFTISDKAVANGSVTFWGSQWDKVNVFSSGLNANSSYKGFIEPNAAKTAPACGGSWTSGTGNSTNPPSTIPAYMAVVVASKVTKSGSTFSGDVKKVVVVKTDAGYDANPGHPGTGKIVGSVC
jgi:hypothetical protein